MMAVTLDRWLSEPDTIIDEVFAAGGPLASALGGYTVNPAQVDYAKILAKAAVRGHSPETTGRITPVEAGTGVGKTLAILIVAGLNATLRGKKALVSTFTRQLNRQMNGSDGRVAIAVVEAVTGKPMKLAVRRPRSAFANPVACLRQAELMTEEAQRSDIDGDTARDILDSAAALREIAQWTSASLTAARHAIENHEVDDYAAQFAGLIETFLEEHPGHVIPLARVPFDLYTLDATSTSDDQVAYSIYLDRTRDADVLIATHAALIRDQSFYGVVLDHDGEGFSMVIADEAHRLEQAGALALGTKRSLSSFSRDLSLVAPVAAAVTDTNTRLRLVELADRQSDRGDKMLELIANSTPKSGQRGDIAIRGDEAWVSILAEAHADSGELVKLLGAVGTEKAKALVSRFNQRHADIDTFLDTVRRHRITSKRKPGETIAKEDFAYASPLLSFSPLRHEPSILAKPKRGARVLSRLWSNPEGARADAIVVTSATMGVPLPRGMDTFTSLLKSIGVSDSSAHLVNHDLTCSIELKKLGTMVSLTLAAPDAPYPNLNGVDRDQNDGERRNPDWVDYVAQAVFDAHQDVWKTTGENRVVVLTTSFDEAIVIAEFLKGRTGTWDIHVRRPNELLDPAFDWLANRKTGVLITPGAFDGVDRPGLIQHLVIPRLPFPADDKSYATTNGNVSEAIEDMMMSLRQGIGRAFRVPSDAAKVWILDPRIGIPDAYDGAAMVRHPKASPMYLNAIPRRFEDQLEAVIFRRPPMKDAAE